MKLNKYGQPVGDELPGWHPRQMPESKIFEGSYCRLEPLDPGKHHNDLFAAYNKAADDRDWTYLPYERPANASDMKAHLEYMQDKKDLVNFAIIDAATEKAVGTIAFMRIDIQNGCFEIGHLNFSPLLKRTPVATETVYLMLKYAFDELGYRRAEWKCDDLNKPSKNAAERFGFKYDGLFKNAVITKGRNRDTAWFSIIDESWADVKKAFETWLKKDNFDEGGKQIRSLRELR